MRYNLIALTAASALVGLLVGCGPYGPFTPNSATPTPVPVLTSNPTGSGTASSNNNLHTDDEVLDDGAISTTSHDNLVVFNYYSPITSVTYSFNGEYSISSGQPWHGITVSNSTGSCTVDANAGRHKTSGPAQWFKDHATRAMCVSTSISGWPGGLNFAFNGTITIDGNSYELVVGQGNDGVHNNWWIGGNQWGGGQGGLVTPDNKYLITEWDVSFNGFYVQPNN